jgi:hypothetical protein
LTKDDNRSTKMAKENDVHVELTWVNMLTWKRVSSKKSNLLKMKNEMTGTNGNSTMSINMSIMSEMNDTSLKTDKG